MDNSVWVLLFVLQSSIGDNSTTSFTQEFESQVLCETAKVSLLTEINKELNTIRKPDVAAICTKARRPQ